MGYFYYKYKDIYIIKFEGEIRYTTSEYLNRFLDMIFEKNDFENIIIDLKDCSYMDSTNLGLLARIASFVLKKNGNKPIIIGANSDLMMILEVMGFETIFSFLDEYPETMENAEKIDVETGGKSDIGEIILNAHKQLAALNERNRETFKDVIKLFEKNKKK